MEPKKRDSAVRSRFVSVVKDSEAKIDVMGFEAQVGASEQADLILTTSEEQLGVQHARDGAKDGVVFNTVDFTWHDIYCSLNSSWCFGITLGVCVYSYWLYDDMYTVGTWHFAYGVILTMIMDLSLSVLMPWAVSVVGYEKVNVASTLFRIITLGIQYFYFTSTRPFPHPWFTFICAIPLIANPQFMIGATKIDIMLTATFPAYRLLGNFFPVLTTSSGFLASSIWFVFPDLIPTKFVILIAIMQMTSCLGLELYCMWQIWKRKKFDIDPFGSLTLYIGTLRKFFTPKLLLTAWTADGVLAAIWIVFGWMVPIFGAHPSASGEYLGLNDIILYTCLFGAAFTSLGCVITAVVMVYETFGITNAQKLKERLIQLHIIASWIGKTLYVLGLIFSPNIETCIAICATCLGSSFATPNSMIMILSVPSFLACAYTGFAQISFIVCAYSGSLWMNFYGDIIDGNYSYGFAIVFGAISVINLLPLTIYDIYSETLGDHWS